MDVLHRGAVRTTEHAPRQVDTGDHDSHTSMMPLRLGAQSAPTGDTGQEVADPSTLRTAGARLLNMGDISSAVVTRWLAAGDVGDFEAFDELLHPDAVIHAPAGLSTSSADEEKAVWRDALAAMPDLRHDVQEVVVNGDIEMARVVVTGTLTASFGGVEGTGRSFRIDQAVITHLRDGKVVEAWEIADIAALRAQVADG
jgi:predicted ester cyclase